ncbi:MAG: BMP family ABC transporter substrate-binding protein, partial [Clostridium sp.]|uniref:BMP family ABC transporter substrate-binding protein n=1 Tax=Clostridium sp. TaxID=1506 RepID=UPI003EE4B5A2
MKKKTLALAMTLLMATGVLAGCGGASEGEKKASIKVGMVTDVGTIDDKSFNQGTWEGIEQAKKDLGIENQYLKPSGQTHADYIKEIGNIYDAGNKFIVTPGYK